MKIASLLVCLVACGGDPFTAADAGDVVDDAHGSPSNLEAQQKRSEGGPVASHDATADVAIDVAGDARAVDAPPDVAGLCCTAQCPSPHPEPHCPGYIAACLVPCP